jgi:hypothetical protein
LHGDIMDLHEALMQVLQNQCDHGRTLEKILATNAELQASLTELGTQLDKAHGEIVAKVAALEAAIAAGGNTTPEVDAALVALKGKVQTLDDLNADA